ncbi:hypothetical protein JOF53_004307 [Crossiella equi]|uniref:Uncharacterized protein n=1 Tax=Crossiella equi TaxID=130796 RepID=A0ABS5AIA3_9PSEU|nr:hypothetical protein [Crossiella equi]MBP2475435.1 hypothetical protein [Crossiella equi]
MKAVNDMWHDEQDVRNALQRIVDTPAPAVRTDLGEVVRRGKRRVLVTRLGAVASVIVAVGGIGLGATALSGSLFSGDPSALPPAASSLTQTGPPPTAAEKLPGFTQLTTPSKPATTVQGGCFTGENRPAPGRAILPEEKYLPQFQKAVADAVGTPPALVFKNYVNENRGHVTLQVFPKDRKQLGYVKLETGRFAGSVEEGADYQRYRIGCDEPQRKLLADGGIIQVYPDGDLRRLNTRTVGAYTPSGRWYNLTVGSGPVDQNGYPKSSFDSQESLADLPLSQEQLVRVATALAALG